MANIGFLEGFILICKTNVDFTNFDASLVPQGSLVVHYTSDRSRVILTREFYIVDGTIARDIPKYISNGTGEIEDSSVEGEYIKG